MLPGRDAAVNTPFEAVRDDDAGSAYRALTQRVHMQRLNMADSDGEHSCLASDAAECVISSADRNVAIAPPGHAIRNNDDTSA
jgi:hypothetical protein